MQNTYQIKNSNSSSSAIGLTVKEKSVTVIFVNRRRNGILLYDTEKEDIQLAIEASPRFKSGEITRTVGESPKQLTVDSEELTVKNDKVPADKKPVKDKLPKGGKETVKDKAPVKDEDPADELPDEETTGDGGDKKPADATSFPEVKSWQDAKEILRSAPYEIPFQGLNTPANILKKAAEVGVVFPNLPAE